MKTTLYTIIITCYALAAICEAREGNWKPMVLALGFGTLNAVIFFWRP